MKLRFEQLIDADRESVWAAFNDPDNMKRWQPTLVSFTPKSGIPGQVDSVAELVYRENDRTVVITETITERRAPAFMAGVYESRWSKTLTVNHFEAVDENITRWESWCKFRFNGVMRFLSLFFAGSIRKRTKADMERFKLLVETEKANEDSL